MVLLCQTWLPKTVHPRCYFSKNFKKETGLYHQTASAPAPAWCRGSVLSSSGSSDLCTIRQAMSLSQFTGRAPKLTDSGPLAPLCGSQMPPPSPSLFPRPHPEYLFWSGRARGFPGTSPSSRVMVSQVPDSHIFLAHPHPRPHACLFPVCTLDAASKTLASRLCLKIFSIFPLPLGSNHLL